LGSSDRLSLLISLFSHTPQPTELPRALTVPQTSTCPGSNRHRHAYCVTSSQLAHDMGRDGNEIEFDDSSGDGWNPCPLIASGIGDL